MPLNNDQALEYYQLPDDYLSIANDLLPPTKEKIEDTFVSTWEINNWSTLSLDSLVVGPTFETNKYQWNVMLFPQGNNTPEYLSLYLSNKNLYDGTLEQDICAQVLLCIVDPTDPARFFHQEFQHRFNKHESNFGFTKYVDLNSLIISEDAVIVQDSVKIITIVRLVHDSTGVLWHKFINYDSKKTTGCVGLFNQGATCYMNSLFQSLFFTNLYRKAVYQIPTENDDPNNSIVLALQRLFYNLQFSDSAASTTELTTSFGWNSIDSFMQHDVQEFNRILQDNIEKKMRNTPAHDSIKKLFVGKMKSYIKCINIDYESSRSEEYYDIQLNVKGCKNLQESFETYVSEEVLEGDNKYMASEHGLQDAKKGVIFDSFPPVLHLQLKRFEYDMVADSMVKINDKHEFPPEINLEPFLADAGDKPQPYRYILHSVLVHTGDLTGGHYFSFVRPTKENKWYKFDDDRVTPASLHEVFEENFGGDGPSQPIHTSAYMLVYIHESNLDQILAPVTSDDIPTHLVKKINQERIINELLEKQRSEQHLYMKAYICNEISFMANTSTGFIQFDENSSTASPPIVQIKQVLKNRPVRQILLDYAIENGVDVQYLRLWNLANRKNGWVQLDTIFSDGELDLSNESVCKTKSDYPFLRVFVEHARIDFSGRVWFPPLQLNWALIFIKQFDPVTQTIRTLGSFYISKEGLVSDIAYELLQRSDLDSETNIDIYEEVGPGFVQELKLDMTFEDYGIGHGDIIVFQVNNSPKNIYPNVIEYTNFLQNHMMVLLTSKNEPNTETILDLSKDMKYNDIVSRLGKEINWNPEQIVLILPDIYGNPGQYVKPVQGMTLLDISRLIPRNNENNKLYYDTLSISLSEYDSKRLIQLYICYPTLNQREYHQVLLPKLANVSDLSQTINSNENLRFFGSKKGILEKVFEPKDFIINDGIILYAEIVPKEELNIGEQDFFISVYHFQKELTQTHSVPFKFLVIKDEVFNDTKKRLKARCGLDDESWNKVKFHIIKKFGKITINQDEYKLSDHSFKSDEMLGLDYTDPLGKYNVSMSDRGLYIKD